MGNKQRHIRFADWEISGPAAIRLCWGILSDSPALQMTLRAIIPANVAATFSLRAG
jgi:hypothetical protein